MAERGSVSAAVLEGKWSGSRMAALVWFQREGEQRRGQGDGVGLRKEDDGGTDCEIGGLCRRLKRKNLQNQRREGGAAALLEKKMGLGLGFLYFFFDVVKIAPPCLAENEGYL